MTGSCASSSKPIQTVPNKTTEIRGGRRFLSHIVSCANTSLIVGVVDQGINTLKARLARIGIHNTKHLIAEQIMTSQDGRSGATERLCADWIFR